MLFPLRSLIEDAYSLLTRPSHDPVYGVLTRTPLRKGVWMLETRARRRCLNYCSRAVTPLPRIVHESYHYNLTNHNNEFKANSNHTRPLFR